MRLWSRRCAETPERPLRWVSKSLRHISAALSDQGFSVSHTLVGRLLKRQGYTLQGNVKAREGTDHPDRDAQFHHINDQVAAFAEAGQPVISVDTKKKELVGDFKNSGREWRPKGSPEEVRVHDFADKELGKAIPYGVYDVINNVGWVNVGVSSDTAAFAVESIRHWWHHLGKERYPEARKLLITRRLRRLQREPRPVMEGGVAEARTRTRHRDQRVPPAARHQQVEPHRTSSILLHQPELARQTPVQPHNHHQPDRLHHDRRGAEGLL